ncbi:uncharacterized protein LOC141684698 [Apium graveolens]|uniref:uncharacterized protein LOC141684698 n=1 Tax=Apium graveolens TaxID=4045 RepID=UPI003D791F95
MNINTIPCISFILVLTLSSLTKHINGNAEVKALMELKSSLDPDNEYLQSWTDEGDPCSNDSFEGVACNLHLKVANISLQGKGLTGSISPAVAGLKCLSGLYLHYNSLSGVIPIEISNLTELSDLYLNVNNLSGVIPPQIGNMASLQVLELCCNHLRGSIPKEVGYLQKLNVLTLQYNRLTGEIPSSIGNMGMLKRLDLSFNHLSGKIPGQLANAPLLEVLEVQNNKLSGLIPLGLKKFKGGFHFGNNSGLCGVGYPSVRACNSWDDQNINQIEPFSPAENSTDTKHVPLNAKIHADCNQTSCPRSSKMRRIALFGGIVTITIVVVAVGLLVFRYRRRKQKIIITSHSISDDRFSATDAKDFYSRSASPLVTLEYSNKWDPMACYQIGSSDSDNFLQRFKFNLEEIESATQYFSEVNLLGKSKFSSVYKGILKDGSFVAIKSINIISCKSEEVEFMNGLRLLTSLRHENLAKLRGFCCSMGRGECFLIHDFACNGSLSRYLDIVDGSSNHILDWKTRISIITGIAKGIGYLHRSETNRPSIVHQNISVEKVLIDQEFNPIIMDSGLVKLLADDIVFSALKNSAALGYMAPEYITTGRFTEKSDVYAFGVIILQVLSGKTILSASVRQQAETGNYDEFIDPNLNGNLSKLEAAKLSNIASDCIQENPECRPTMKAVIRDLSNQIF